MIQPLAWWVIGLALVFDFLVGAHGAGNVVSTVISSRAFRPATALLIGALAEFLGPLILGTAVARTVGSQIIKPGAIALEVILAALLAAIGWQLLTWLLSLPSSSSHGLIGGLVGAAVAAAGWDALQVAGLLKVVAALFIAPVIAFGVGFLLLRLIYSLAAGASPRINQLFRRGQLLTVTVLALSNGANDSQKAMALIVLALVVSGLLPAFVLPTWVVLLCAGVMALGTLLAGWRLIRAVGGKFFRVRPVHSLAAQLSSAVIMLVASLWGLPVSTANVVSSAVIGVGASERISKVRWSAASDILMAWVLTIPATALFSAGLYWLIARLSV